MNNCSRCNMGKPLEEFKKHRNGNIFKTCKECLERKKMDRSEEKLEVKAITALIDGKERELLKEPMIISFRGDIKAFMRHMNKVHVKPGRMIRITGISHK